MKNKVLVILGMHRSGTSLITRWLHKCGIDIGQNLAGPDLGNIDGHFEDMDFSSVHENILVGHGIKAHGLMDRVILKLTEKEKRRLLNLIEGKMKLNHEWGWKDPRTCLFLSFYRERLTSTGYYFIILRHYSAVVSSLIIRDFKYFEKSKLSNQGLINKLKWYILYKGKKRNEFYAKRSEAYLKVWITYNKELLNHILSIEKNKFLLINYQDLIYNWRDTLTYLKEMWGFAINYVDYNSIFKNRLISKKMIVDDFITDKQLISKANKIFQELANHKFDNKNIFQKANTKETNLS
jgi:hypothetical protein